MRRKRVELREDIVIAARRYVGVRKVTLTPTAERISTFHELVAALKALDEYEAATLTGGGARWAEGSDTSRQAAALARPTQNSTRHEIVGLLASVPHLSKPGYTDDQMERRLKRSHQTVSSARNWLTEAGWVRDSGTRRNTRSNRPAVVWELTPTAWKQLTGR